MRTTRLTTSTVLALALALGVPAVASAAPDAGRDVSTNAVGMSPRAEAVTAVAINRANEKTMFDFLVGKGLTKRQAAGVVGNLDVESGMDPTISQIGGGPGRGIAQWSVGGRWDTYAGDNLVDFANQRDLGRWSMNAQKRFVWFELSNFSYYGLADLKNTTTIEGATRVFMNKYEGCGDCHVDRRVQYAKDAFDRYR